MRDDERNPKTAAGVTPGTAALEHEIHDANRDPVTGEPGAHPVGTGVGAASGGTVGAVIGGAVGGPLGAMVGAAVGGIAGGLAGKGISESVNPTEEDAFWRDHYSTRPYASGRTYDDLQPAYRHGWEARTRYEDRSWNDVESDLERDWTQRHGSSGLGWNDARNATRDAWDRITDRFGGSQETGDRSGLHSDVGNTTGYAGTSFTGAANTPAGSVASGMAGHELGTKGLAEGPTHLGNQTGPATSTGTTLSSPAGSHLTGSGGTMTAGSIGAGTAATGLAGGTPSTITGWTGTSGASGSSRWEDEDSYWRNNYSSRPYSSGRTYDDLSPAYRYGYESANQYRGRSWNEAESDLERGWEKAKGASRGAWQDVKDAVRDAWHRVERATPGDADRDGR
ncbi:MAG TPA: hypothetical protein VF414_19640 [Thermoanaerobaculia bacterium]